MATQLGKTHPVSILISEHEIILQNLKELKEIAEKIKMAQGSGEIKNQLKRLKEIAHLLLETESHHQREEQALFPRLERRGISGPPQVMRLEHEQLRAKKKRLAELTAQAESQNYTQLSRELHEVGSYIASTLQNHIFKEDNILYPMALRIFQAEEWPEITKEFDRIGYCPFTPSR